MEDLKKALVYINHLKLSDLLKFKLYIKQCYCILWSAEEIQKVKKAKGLKKQKTEE